MLELLILYTLNKTELTLYGLRMFISKHFGEFSIPSDGAVFPAVKRLQDKGFVSLRKKLSNGGKRYTYYSVSNNYADFFNKKFMEFNTAKSETLDSFLLWLKVRLCVSELLDRKLFEEFKQKSLMKLEKYETKINEKFNDSYLELNELQKNILSLSVKEILEYKKLLQN